MVATFYVQINPMEFAFIWMKSNAQSMRFDLSSAKRSHGGLKILEANDLGGM